MFPKEILHISGQQLQAKKDLDRAINERKAYEILSTGSVKELELKNELMLEVNQRIAKYIGIIHSE